MGHLARSCPQFSLLAWTLAGCGGDVAFLSAPAESAAGWIVAIHRPGEALEVRAQLDWTEPLRIAADQAQRIELLAYDAPFPFSAGPVPPAGAPRTVPQSLPEFRAAYRSQIDEGSAADFEQVTDVSPELRDFQYGADTPCVRLTNTSFAFDGVGDMAMAWFEDDAALLAAGPAFYLARASGVVPFSACSTARVFNSLSPLGNDTFRALAVAPAELMTIRFDRERMTCEVLSTQPLPSGRLVLSVSPTGGPTTDTHVLTSSGALFALDAESGWRHLGTASRGATRPLSNDIGLLEIAPGELAAFFNSVEVVRYSARSGFRTHPLPDPPALEGEPGITSMAYAPAVGIVAGTSWGDLYRSNEDARDWTLVHAFGNDVKRLVSFRNGVIAFPQEGGTRQLYPGLDLCADFNAITSTGLIETIGRGDRVVAVYREPDVRRIYWVRPE